MIASRQDAQDELIVFLSCKSCRRLADHLDPVFFDFAGIL